MNRISPILIAAGFFATACEFRPATQSPPQSPPPLTTPTAQGITSPISLLPLIPIFSESGAFLGKGVPLDNRRLFVTGILVPSATMYLATQELSPLPVTLVQEGVGYLLLYAQTPFKLLAPPPLQERITPGELLYRIQPRALYEERETLEVLAVNERFLVLRCPRSAGGYLFTGGGEWVPGIWLPDPQGGCPIFRLGYDLLGLRTSAQNPSPPRSSKKP